MNKQDIVEGVKDFLRMIPGDDMKKSLDHLLIFQLWTGPNALVSLFTSSIKGNREIGEESIRLFLINPISRTGFLPKPIQNQCALIVLQFCSLLLQTPTDEGQCLYNSCRETLVCILNSIAFANRSTYFGFSEASLHIKLLFPVILELSKTLSPSLSTAFNCLRSSFARDVRDFILFSLYMRRAIEEHVTSKNQSLPLCVDDNFEEHPCYMYQIQCFYDWFTLLSERVMLCLSEFIRYSGPRGVQKFNPMWSYYLSLLKEFNDISKLYQGAEKQFSASLEARWLSVGYLIMHSKRRDENEWILEIKNSKGFESRKCLMMMMVFPEVKYDNKKRHKILIDRSQLLTESFKQITHANPKLLQIGLLVAFKHELSSGPGVLREWLFLVCQDLFNPQNSLFLASPSDQRRFFPNPAKMDRQRLNYFRFCGRIIALALMYKVQVGIAFDRLFFLQLAGKEISLEDVRNADPCMYKSCKDILGMDADFVDSDAMGLTFVHETEEFGSRKVVELLPGGNTIVVNSKNREEYVNLLIRYCFVKSISAKVTYFSQGLSDILRRRRLQKFFFRILELKDLDYLLLGDDKAISVKDWKAHTDYDDFKETDDQICWFWKVVEGMSTEQQRELLFFWTSVKFLPVNGFSGLPSRLHIFKTKGSHCHLPSSHTCFYRLGLPYYPSLAVMQQHLFLICQKQVGCGFGLS